MNGQLGRPAGSLLKITCITGFFLLAITVAAFVFSALMGRSDAGPSPGLSQTLFEFDRRFWQIRSNAEQAAEADIAALEKSLDRMEKNAISAVSHLSVLKRRRQLAQHDSRYLESYRMAALRARKLYPYSEELAALASAALVQGKAINAETETALRSCIPYLSSPRTDALRLSLHVLLGDLQNPQKAAGALTGAFQVFSVPLTLADRQAMIINAALLKIIRQDSAVMEIDELLRGYYNDRLMPSIHALSFAADYHYDFGELLTAAELYKNIPTDDALMRQADALWLAGFPGAARNIWNVLAAESTGYQARALYNLALTENSSDNAMRHLRAVLSLPRNKEEPAREFGVIRYSRMLSPVQAVPVLEAETAAGANSADELLKLELLRRRTELWESRRLTGAVWLLLEQYPDDERIYQWADWYFVFQRSYTETAMLIKTGARHQFFFPLAEAVLYINEGNFDKAEQILLTLASGDNPSWEAQANLGRILEARHDPARGLEYYEKASATVSNNTDASRIQCRIAQCLKSLGRFGECRRVLEYALDLNPDNINARLELSRIAN